MKKIAVLALLFVLPLTACAANDSPVAEPPAATSTPPSTMPSESPSATPVANDVTFTFQCGYFTTDGTPATIPGELLSFEEAWAHDPATAWCEPIQHGTEFTALQNEAVALAGDVLPDGITQVGGLYAQCAMRDNGYLKLTALAPNQAQEVRGFLHLCPNRPGAGYLGDMLGA